MAVGRPPSSFAKGSHRVCYNTYLRPSRADRSEGPEKGNVPGCGSYLTVYKV